MIWFWNQYLAESFGRIEPGGSLLYAGDLSEFPPAVILTAEHDVLRDEGEVYAGRLQKAGVLTEFRRFAGRIHGFFSLLTLPDSELDFQ